MSERLGNVGDPLTPEQVQELYTLAFDPTLSLLGIHETVDADGEKTEVYEQYYFYDNPDNTPHMGHNVPGRK